jgi:hypothetical protein
MWFVTKEISEKKIYNNFLKEKKNINIFTNF